MKITKFPFKPSQLSVEQDTNQKFNNYCTIERHYSSFNLRRLTILLICCKYV